MSGISTIRCFDLGGSGLKTALVTHNSKKNKMKIKSEVVNLGRCPDDEKISEWVRKKLDLDNEIKEGYLFGFSLAGLDKLRKKPAKTGDISKLFNLPPEKTGSIDDGSAHLTASLNEVKEIPKGRIWNFSIGTGVGFGITNSKHDIRPPKDLKKFFGKDSWDVIEPTTGKAIWQAGSSKEGFDKIEGSKKKAMKIFANRWKEFIHKQILAKSESKENEWARPTAVVFTGGHLDWHGDKLVKKLNKIGLEVPAFAGPREAGIIGAAWHVAKHVM